MTRASLDDCGCWIEGSWGQYGIAREVDLASEHGFANKALIDIALRKLTRGTGQAWPQVTDREEEMLCESEPDVTSWLNEHVAPEGCTFEWSDGEFFLQTSTWWSEN